MSLRILIHGYDLYRSTADLGPVNLRGGIPNGLEKINRVPIVVSGNAPAEGPDAFLAMDDGDILTGGEGLQGGDTYNYYLVARDLAGNYSETAGPLIALVPDTLGPVTPWNVHSQREEPDTGPRLTLIWDQINNLNYLKNYGTGKQICGSSSTEICYVPVSESCGSRPPTCLDLDVVALSRIPVRFFPGGI